MQQFLATRTKDFAISIKDPRVNVTYAPFGNDVIGEMIVYAIGTAVVVKKA